MTSLPLDNKLLKEVSSKNIGLDITKITSGSKKKLIWVCDQGHEWEARVQHRTNGSGCPFCSGRQAVKGETSLAAVNPSLAQEWDYETNGNLTPDDVGPSSHQKVNWICKQNHRYKTTIKNRNDGKGCPVCKGRQVVEKINSLAFLNPELAKEWDYDNNTKTPAEVTVHSNYNAGWICAVKQHRWKTTVHNRSNGGGCGVCAGRKVQVESNDFLHLFPLIANEWHPTKNIKKPEEVTASSHYRAFWVCAQGHEWGSEVYNRAQGKNCPQCSNRVSKAEQEITAYLLNLGLVVETGNRTVLDGKEIDIYLPKKNIGIEYNGLYWHNEESGKGRHYHYDKWLAAKESGVQLIQVWEDDWNRDKDVILNGLKHKLGLSNQEKVFARKTVVVNLTVSEAQDFLNINHIQGFASGSYYLGLQTKAGKELKAVLVLKKESGTNGKVLNIIRYATNAHAIGGFTKLLQYAITAYSPESFITFADHTVSDGGLYEKNGFIADKELAPDYMYVVKGERKHKFGYRLKRFKNDPDLLWEEGLTERELAKLNNFSRIWDAGKTRYRFMVNR